VDPVGLRTHSGGGAPIPYASHPAPASTSASVGVESSALERSRIVPIPGFAVLPLCSRLTVAADMLARYFSSRHVTPVARIAARKRNATAALNVAVRRGVAIRTLFCCPSLDIALL
jgi:hypothetical protein